MGPDGHLAVILPWCRQEKECTCAKEESQKGEGLSPVLITAVATGSLGSGCYSEGCLYV